MTKDINCLIEKQNNKIADIASTVLQFVPIETEDILFWADVTRTSSELGMLIKVNPNDFDDTVKIYQANNGMYYMPRMVFLKCDKIQQILPKEVVDAIEDEIADKIRALREFMVENFGENNNFSWISLRMDKETLYEYKFEYEPFHNVEFLEKHHLLGWCDIGSYIPYEELGIYMDGEDLSKDFIKGTIKAKELWNKEYSGN